MTFIHSFKVISLYTHTHKKIIKPESDVVVVVVVVYSWIWVYIKINSTSITHSQINKLLFSIIRPLLSFMSKIFFWLVICYRKNVAKIIVNKIFLSLCFDLFVIIIIFFFVIFSLLFSIHSTTPPTHIHTIESYDFFFVFWLLGFVLNSLCWLEKVHTHIVWLLRFEKNHYYF